MKFNRLSILWAVFQIGVFWIVSSTPAFAELTELDTHTAFDSVYLFKDTESSVITVGLTVLAGEVDVKGPEGLSHYLEHLMYWHATQVNNQQAHARGGNAWVNGILTTYYNESERGDLDDLLEFVHRLFKEPELDENFMLRERSVVEREYDLRVSENPERRIYTSIKRTLYDNLPLSRSVIGTPESIRSLTLQHASEFHQAFYHPANSVLFIAGNIDQTEAKALIEEKFSGLKPGERHNADWRDAIIKSELDTTTQFTEAQVNFERLIYMSLSEWPEGTSAIENWYTLRMLLNVLDSALDGGIAKPLRMENFVLRSFQINLHSVLENYFELELYAEPDKGITLEQASDTITATLQEIADAGIPSKTLERVRKRMLQSETKNTGSMRKTYFRLAEQLNSGLQPLSSEEHLQHIEAVSLEQVNHMVRSLAAPKRRTVAFIEPGE